MSKAKREKFRRNVGKGCKGNMGGPPKGSKGVIGARTMKEAQAAARETTDWLGMSYTRIAKLTGLDMGFVSRVMGGKRTPSIETLELIGGVTGRTMVELMTRLGIGVEEREEVVIEGKQYVIGGRRYNRNTHVLGTVIERPGLDKWRREVGLEEATRLMVLAGAFGDLVHNITACVDAGRENPNADMMKKDEGLRKCVEAWYRWRDKFVVEFVAIEKMVWSDKYGVAGTLDREAMLKGDDMPSILDIKTGGLYETVGMQLFGYREMRNERPGRKGPAKRVLAIQLPRKRPGHRTVKEYYEKGGWVEKWKDAVTKFNETAFYDNI